MIQELVEPTLAATSWTYSLFGLWSTLFYSIASIHWGLQEFIYAYLSRSHHSLSCKVEIWTSTGSLQQHDSFIFQPICYRRAAVSHHCPDAWHSFSHLLAVRRMISRPAAAKGTLISQLQPCLMIGMRWLCWYAVWCCALWPTIFTLVSSKGHCSLCWDLLRCNFTNLKSQIIVIFFNTTWGFFLHKWSQCNKISLCTTRCKFEWQ